MIAFNLRNKLINAITKELIVNEPNVYLKYSITDFDWFLADSLQTSFIVPKDPYRIHLNSS